MAKVQILIVEDDNIVVMELRDRLQSLGYAVCAVVSYGEEAVAKAAEMRPDLVLMDIRLKGDVNGIDAAKEIRVRFDIPVVYLTAYADEATLQRAKVTEPYGYIIKPFQEGELHTAIEVALYKHGMERRLKESERWLGTVLRSISDAVIATDREGLVTFMNPVAETLTGWKQEEALGRDLTEVFNIINEQTRIPAENPATRALREGVVVGLADHTILIAKDGKETPLDDSAAPIRDDKGNVIGVVLVFRDITERKRAEEALRESEEKYKNLVENSAYGFFMMDLDGKYTYCNRVGEEITGYSSKELREMNFSDLIIEEDIRRARHDFEDVAAGYPNTGPRVYRVKTKTGKIKDIEVNTLAIWKKGEIVEFHGTAVDITERKRVEEEIRQRTAQLEALRQVGLELTAQLDLDTLLHSIVSRAIELLGGTYGGLYLHRPERGVLEWSVAVGPNLAPIGTVLRRGEGLSGKVWELGEPLIVGDYRAWEERAAVYEGYPFRAVVGVPVHWGDEFLGVLNVLADPSHTFSPSDAELLGLFATQAAIAIRNARLYEETRRRAERLAVVNRVAQAASATLRLDDLAETVYQEITRVFQANAFFLALYDPETDVLDYRLRVDEGIREALVQQLMEAGLTAQVVTSKKPLLIRDFEKEKDGLPPAQVWGTMKIPASWLGVPMQIGEKVIGVICVQAYRPNAYGEEEELLLSTIADQVAVAVENARLYEETRRRGLEQETVSRIAYALNTPDVREAFPVLVEGLQDLTRCDLVNLIVMDEAAEQFIISLLESPFPIPGEGDVMPLSATAVLESLKAGRPHLTVDLSTETRFPFEQALYQAGLRSRVTLPLLVGGEIFGALNLGGSHTGLFREDQLPVLQQIADALALALQNSFIFQAEQERRHIAETLRQASAVFSSTLELDEVLGLILQQLRQVIPYDSASVQRLQEEHLEIVACQGFEEPDKVVGLVFPLAPKFPNYRVVMTKAPLAIEDVVRDYPHFKDEANSYESGAIRSWLGVPLIVKDEVIGMIAVDRAEVSPYTAEEVQLAMAFGSHAAIAIENARLYQEAERLAITDGLTGLYNRRHFYDLLERGVESASRYDDLLSLIMLDIDDFKAYNDTYGHTVGDALLRELAQLLVRDIRKVDIAARYGGDEFIILLPHTDKKQAVALADRIRTSVEGHRFPGEEGFGGKVTISLGVANCPEDAVESEALVKAADMALLKAKKQGNRVCAWGEGVS
jgi:diguanylate cyclase (GGDEF)-like protein/PAS domain S-box-containing protein